MSRAARKSMISCEHPELSVAAQCALLKVPRSTFYYQQEPMREAELALRRSIDVIYTRWPFYGSRRMVLELADEGYVVSRKRVRRLMQSMGLAVIYQKPNTSAAHPGHRIYPYLLRNIVINRPNQVWCADITYIPMARGFVYLVAVMDWFSRKVLAWRLSLTMDAGFCAEALQEAMDNHGKPEIFNTDQGAQFTSEAFTGMLAGQGIQISMDGKGRFLDNIFIERLWRSLKYEEVYLKAYASVAEAREGIGAWISFYNGQRKHQSLGYLTPSAIFAAGACGYVDNASGSAGTAVHCAALTTYPQAQQQAERDSHQTRRSVGTKQRAMAA
jgi:putative transposase